MVGIKHVNMEERIYEVLRKHKLPLKKREELIIDLCDLYNVSQSEFRDSLITKTETMEEFAKIHYKPEYFEGVRNALRNMRVNINLIYDKHFG